MSLLLILVVSVVDSGCEPVTGVVDPGGTMLPVSLTPAININLRQGLMASIVDPGRVNI